MGLDIDQQPRPLPLPPQNPLPTVSLPSCHLTYTIYKSSKILHMYFRGYVIAQSLILQLTFQQQVSELSGLIEIPINYFFKLNKMLDHFFSMSKQGNKKCWGKEIIQNDTVGFHLVITCQILIRFQFCFHGFENGEGRQEWRKLRVS